jgi:hypothetical protein
VLEVGLAREDGRALPHEADWPLQELLKATAGSLLALRRPPRTAWPTSGSVPVVYHLEYADSAGLALAQEHLAHTPLA